jgi:NADPH-dependent F420 reductase
MARIAFLGGTGREGLGLALRFARAGERILIGSRSKERAEQAAETLRARVPSPRDVDAEENGVAARLADIVALTAPFSAVEHLVSAVAGSLAGKIVLEVVNPLQQRAGGFAVAPVGAGSVGEWIQTLVPQAWVVSGFKHLSAKSLWAADPLRGDVLLCSDTPEATRYFIRLTARIPELRAIDAGPLANARALESISVLLLDLNRRYHATASIRILGLHT